MEELIVKENNQKRLDSYVTDKLSKVSRTTAQRLIEEEKILVNGKKQKASYKPEEGDVISIEIPEAKDVELKAQDIPVPVVYEDNDIIVVNKPKGMVVHPANGNPDGTLVNAILAMCKDSLSGIGGEIRPGIITDEVVEVLKECIDLAPLHNPAGIIGIEACKKVMPGKPMVAVFDTTFHQTMPKEKYVYPIPYKYYEKYGVRKYGAHGTSHLYVSQRLAEIENK